MHKSQQSCRPALAASCGARHKTGIQTILFGINLTIGIILMSLRVCILFAPLSTRACSAVVLLWCQEDSLQSGCLSVLEWAADFLCLKLWWKCLWSQCWAPQHFGANAGLMTERWTSVPSIMYYVILLSCGVTLSEDWAMELQCHFCTCRRWGDPLGHQLERLANRYGGSHSQPPVMD